MGFQFIEQKIRGIVAALSLEKVFEVQKESIAPRFSWPKPLPLICAELGYCKTYTSNDYLTRHVETIHDWILIPCSDWVDAPDKLYSHADLEIYRVREHGSLLEKCPL